MFFQRKAYLCIMISWYNNTYTLPFVYYERYSWCMQCNQSLCSCRWFIKCRHRISTGTSPSSSRFLHNLRPGFRFIRPADTRQWFTEPTGLFHSFSLPPCVSFLLWDLCCPFISHLTPCSPLPLFNSPLFYNWLFHCFHICVSSVSPHAELWEIC